MKKTWYLCGTVAAWMLQVQETVILGSLRIFDDEEVTSQKNSEYIWWNQIKNHFGEILWKISKCIFTVRKRSCSKVMFLHLSVSNSVHGGGVSGTHHRTDTLHRADIPRQPLQRTVCILLECFLVFKLRLPVVVPRVLSTRTSSEFVYEFSENKRQFARIWQKWQISF